MQTRDEVMALLARMSETAWAHQTLRAMVECGVLEKLGEPRSAGELALAGKLPTEALLRALEVLVALGLVSREGERFVASPGLKPMLNEAGVTWLRADLRATLLQSAAFAQAAREGGLALGWSFTDPDVLQAQGDLSLAQFDMVSRMVLPNLESLPERLNSDGALALDVGCGVAGGAIGLCRAFAKLKVVGLEPASVPLELARMNVTTAGLDSRITLRHEKVEALDEDSVYEMAWLPQMFLPDEVLSAALPRLLRAIKPGGWLLTAAMSPPAADLAGALARLRNTLFGGRSRNAEALQKLLVDAGFARVLPVPTPNPAMQPVVAQR